MRLSSFGLRSSALQGMRRKEHRVVKPAILQAALEQSDIDEQLLKDLVRKLALFKSSLGSQSDAEQLIAASKSEIERTRHENQVDLEKVNHEIDEASSVSFHMQYRCVPPTPP